MKDNIKEKMHPYTIYDSEKICNPRDKKNGLM